LAGEDKRGDAENAEIKPFGKGMFGKGMISFLCRPFLCLVLSILSASAFF
jgi:hypothetical protein